MKKFLFVLAGVAAMLAACTKELGDNSINNGSPEKVTIVASIASDDELKTTLDGSSFAWGDSETIVVADGTASARVFTVYDKAAGTFTGTKEGDLRFAATPASAFSTIPASGTVLNVYLPGTYTYAGNTPQTNALMIAGAPEDVDGKYFFSFRHAAALMKFTVVNLPVGTKVFRFTSDQYISGYVQKDVSGAVSISCDELQAASKTVLIGLETAVASANTSMDFYVPVPVGDYRQFEVSLLNDANAVLATKTKTLASPVSIARADIFKTPVITLPGVAMPYACLTYEDYDAAEGTGNSYNEVSVVKTHGDAWKTNACKSGGAIQVGRFDSGSHRDSYIKLPDFSEKIDSVKVTLKSVTADKTITLETSADGTEGSVASVTTTDELVYTFNLVSGSFKTAYLRVSGAATLISKIEVWSGTDTRTALSDPAGVSATLNASSATVTNTIDISWNAVDNAASYIVTLLDEGSNISTFETTATSYSATGLEYSTGYLIAVQAIPADPYLYKPSGEASASDVVTTGAEPGGVKYAKVTAVSDVVTGEYVIAAYVGGKYYAMSNSFAGQPAATEVSVSGDKIAEADAAPYSVTLTVSEGKVTIYNGSSYLNCQASGTSFAVSSTAVEHLLSASTAGAGTFRICHPTTNTRAIIYRTTGVFGNYATSNVGNGSYYDVELFKKNDTRKDSGIAWSETSASANIGNGNVVTFSAPSLANPNGLTVTYSTDDATVADVDATTGAVEIKGEGEAKISAVFAGNDTYKPATVSYTVTVTDAREAVATPTFNPAAGEVASGTEVSIVCAAADEIYYTLDGSEPDNLTATKYTAPITVSAAVTIKAIAYKEGWKPSAVASAAYTIALSTTNDGSLEHPYTPEEAAALANVGNTGTYYIAGVVAKIQNQFDASFGTANFWLSIDGVATDVFEGYKIKYIGNKSWVAGNKLIEVGDQLVIYGTLTMYNDIAETSSGYIVSWNGLTKALTAGTLTATPDNAAKTITVAWGAAEGSSETITYEVSCGTQTLSPNPTAAGSHTFAMSDYGTYDVTVVASAGDAVPVSSSVKATLEDPTSTTKDYYKLVTSVSDITAGTYVVGALRSTSATNNFYFAKASVSSGDWVVSDAYVTVADNSGVRRFEVKDLPSGAAEFTLTGNNTEGFTISNGSNYLYYTTASNRKLAIAAAGSSQKWTVSAKSSPLISGGVVLKAVGGQNYTISENSTGTGAIRGYANTTEYRAIYLFKKVNE